MNDTLPAFARLLQEAIGLDAASIGSGAVERAVRARMQACTSPDLDSYWPRVCQGGPELQLLIESVVVAESWFFRDRQAFVALAARAQQLRARHPQARLLVLSIPCAGGEEPYSIAMALLDAGLSAAQFRVDAVDVSERALEAARSGCYGRNAFRGDDLAFRERHFERASDGFRISAQVRECVAFRRGNLFDPALFDELAAEYSMVFCRNLLIYFDRPTQRRALALLQSRLGADGALFVAPSEAGLMLQSGFRPLPLPLAFGFAPPDATAARPARRASARVASAAPAPPRPPPSTAAHTATLPGERNAGAGHDRSAALAAARALADGGRLDAAADACAALLREHGADADALSLLGLVRDAAGRHADAEHCYRKALYLDPQHGEALVHLAYLLERQGETAAAERLRARMRRAASAEPRP